MKHKAALVQLPAAVTAAGTNSCLHSAQQYKDFHSHSHHRRASLADMLTVLQSARPPPTSIQFTKRTRDPCPRSEVGGSNRGPLAVVGPDRKLVLPVSSLLLNGSGSTDDRGIVSYHWHVRPPRLKVEGADQAVATVTGLRAGRYNFTLTVSDQQGATDSASLTLRVQGGEGQDSPPVVHASGSHSLTLPNNSLVLRGSVSDADPSEVHFLWVRDSQSPAAGDVLYGSETQASLYLANLVEGTYLFQLRVSDAQGRSGSATATVEVRPAWWRGGGGAGMQVAVFSGERAQRDKLVRQLAALIHVLDSDIQVRALLGHSHLSTVLRLSVRGPQGPVSGSRLCVSAEDQLLREKSDYLLRRQKGPRRKTKYTILDNMDEQERLELRPKFSDLMMSESELDSDQDTIFSRERPVRSRNRTSASAARNGNAFG
ncbi:hypothetical protein F7725_017695 [Dissostichus mawsoni]|uniref:PKD/Chitinase domain-containing protein n=1 Tax=Dissostichus mawsoni TaxID=36200 RepID=A0A7J5XSB0_DISMA|nr:hypothetical protein F7725_017695 [Dissostichus mawsoni]